MNKTQPGRAIALFMQEEREMRQLKWALINGGMLSALIAGFALPSEGLLNIGLFLVWANIAVTPFLLNDHAAATLRQRGRPVPRRLDLAMDVSIILVLTYFGAMITAAFWLVHLSIYDATYRAATRPDRAKGRTDQRTSA